MKIQVCLGLALITLLFAGSGNDSSATPNPSLAYTGTANTLAEQFLAQGATLPASDEKKTEFEKTNGFDGFADLVTAFVKAEAIGEALVGKGVKPGTAVFKMVLAETTGVSASAPVVKAPDPGPAANDPKNDTTKTSPPPLDPNANLLTGLNDLRGSSKTSILFLAHVYRIPPPGYEKVSTQKLGPPDKVTADKWDTGIELLQNRSILDEIALIANPKKNPSAPKETDDEIAKAASDAKLAAVAKYKGFILNNPPIASDIYPNSFTDLLIAHGKAVTEQTATKLAAAKDAEETATKLQASAEAKANAAAAGKAPATDATPTGGNATGPKATAVLDSGNGKLADTVLRNMGISFGAGIGVATGSHSSSAMESGILRWNIIQEQATIRWNDIQSIGGQGTKRVGYGLAGIQGRKLMEDEFGYSAETTDIEKIFWRPRYSPTSFGPFIGTAFAGNYATFGHNTDGSPIKERPYLAGLQIGWGFYDEAASLLYVDVGATISPNSGFRYSRPYFGISADGLVLLDLFQKMRALIPGAPEASSTGK